jgi:hypothetical protein
MNRNIIIDIKSFRKPLKPARRRWLVALGGDGI